MYFHESDDKMGSHIRKCSKHFLEVRTWMEEESRHQGHHLCRSSQRKCALIRTKQTHMNCNYLFWACSPTHSFSPTYLPTDSPAHSSLTTDLPIYPPAFSLCIHPPIHIPIHPPTHILIYSSIYLSLYIPVSLSSIPVSIHLPTHPSTRSPIHSPIQPAN